MDKYHELDKQVSNEVMEEVEGKVVEHTCQDCQGRGWYWNKNPVLNHMDRIGCENCEGTGRYEVEY